MPVTLANGINIQTSDINIAILNLLVNEENVRTDLHNVYYYLELDSNLISLKTLEKNGCSFTANKRRLRVLNPNSETILKVNKVNILYTANLISKSRTEGIRANKITTINL